MHYTYAIRLTLIDPKCFLKMSLGILSWACLPGLLLLQLLALSGNVNAGELVTELPGFTGPLPFKLETGYVTLNEMNLFYYFVESQGDPTTDPVILYLIGGPCCSALNGLVFQTGPVLFNVTDYQGGLPRLFLNDFTWTKSASILFPDITPGSGFSYSTNAADYYISDALYVKRTVQFIHKWYEDNPDFVRKQLYIATDSYAGVSAPMIAQQIMADNNGAAPYINLMGIISGCAHVNTFLEYNSKIPFAYRMALIPKSLYETAKNSCDGNYVSVDSSNAGCLEALAAVEQLTDPINKQNILEPNCALLAPNPNDYKGEEVARRTLVENLRHSNLQPLGRKEYWCRNLVYYLVDVWANDRSVREALHVRNGTIKEWERCNLTLQANYPYDINDAVPYYENLTKTGLQVLIYGGDHDMVIPHISSEAWIRLLNITIEYYWRPWFVNGQVAGYTYRYYNSGFRLTYATVKGSGHSPTEYEHQTTYEMFARWIHHYPI